MGSLGFALFLHCAYLTLSEDTEWKGIRVGSRVIRGPNWEYGDQDGGAGGKGTVLELRPWRRALANGTSPTGLIAARVLWDATGSVNAYRWDAPGTGERDLSLVGWRPLSVEEASLPSFYEEALALAGARERGSAALVPALRELWVHLGGLGWHVKKGWREAFSGGTGVPDSSMQFLPCGAAAGALGRGNLGWEGVVCSTENLFVLGLDLSGNGLRGNLSGPAWDLLPEGLQSLSLARNSLYGPLPPTLCRFKGLRFLDLSSNHLEGPLLACLGDLTSLEVLYLSDNSFTGSLPPSWARLRALQGLHLHGNEGLVPPASEALRGVLKKIKHLTLPSRLKLALGY